MIIRVKYLIQDQRILKWCSKLLEVQHIPMASAQSRLCFQLQKRDATSDTVAIKVLARPSPIGEESYGWCAQQLADFRPLYLISRISEMLDHAYSYPPSIDKAELHQRATAIFKTGTDKLIRCDCCQRLVGTKEIPPTCYDPKRMAFLGQGIPLYFLMLRNVLVLLATALIVLGGYALYSNWMGSECSTGATACQVTAFNQLSILNKATHTSELQAQNYLVLSLIVVLILVMQYIRRSARMLESECDRLVDSPSDYSMIIRRLPNDYKEEDIKAMIEQRRKFLTPQQLHETNGMSVQKIVVAYSLKQITEITEKNAEAFKESIKKKTKFEEKQLPTTHRPTQTAIVTFSSQKSKDYFITEPKFYQKFIQFFVSAFIPASEFTVKNKFVSIQRAPEPDDINWNNCGITFGGSLFRRFLGLLFTLLFLGLGAAVQIGLQYLDEKVLTDPNIKTYSSTIFSIVVSIFNGIMSALLIVITRKERLETVTQYNQRLAVKITLYQFINAGILVVISNSIFILDFDKFAQKFSLAKGLASDATQIMILNVLAPNISLLILNYFAPGKWWARRSIKKQLENTKDVPGTVYTQDQVNQSYQGMEIDLASRYSFVLRTMLLTALFAPFIPIAIPLAILSIGLNYLIEKFLFARSYKVPNMTSSILDNDMIELLEYFPLVLALGNYFLYLYFVYFQFDQVPVYYGVPIYISILVSVINIFLPMDSLNECLFPLKDMKVERPFFRQVEYKFITDYDIANPIYRHANKKRKNYKFFADLAPLGGLFEMVSLDKTAEKTTDFGSPKKDQKQPLLDKHPAQGFMQLFEAPHTANNQQILHESVKNKVKEMTSSGSVRSLLQNQQRGGTPVQINQQTPAPMIAQPFQPGPRMPPPYQAPPPPPQPPVQRANSMGMDLGMALTMGANMANNRQSQNIPPPNNTQMMNPFPNMAAPGFFPPQPPPFQPPGFNNGWNPQQPPNGRPW